MATVVVAGAIANKHRNGGEAWVRLSWVEGLERLGCRVVFVEQIGADVVRRPPTGARRRSPSRPTAATSTEVMESFGLLDRSALVCPDDRRERRG